MYRTIRNPSTKIGKPTHSRDEYTQRLAFVGKENSARTVYTTCDRLPGEDRSTNVPRKIHAFKGHDATETISGDLMRPEYTMDTAPFCSANSVVKPQVSTEDDSVSGYQLSGGSHGYVQDDSQFRNMEDWRFEDDAVEETGDELAAQINSELSQSLFHTPPSTPRGTGKADRIYDTTDVATAVADDSDEFDEQVDDTTLISIEEVVFSTPISLTFPSTPLTDSERRTPVTLHQQYHGNGQELSSSWTADRNEDELGKDSVAFFDDPSMTADAKAASDVGQLESSISAPLDESDLGCLANPSLPVLADSGPCTSPQQPTKSRDSFPVEVQSTSWRSAVTRFKPPASDVKLNVTAATITQAPSATTGRNVSGNAWTIQESHRSKPPALPSAPPHDPVTGESGLRGHCPKDCAPQPFLRPPFPGPVSSRSPIQGLTSTHTLLRTCFRIGEALNAGLSSTSHSPSRFTKHPSYSSSSGISPNPHPPQGRGTTSPSTATVLVELYAFVEHSYRSNNTQFFRFADLFSPSRPPYLCGEWQGWKGNPVYEADGRAFLGIDGREWKFTDATASGKRKRKSAAGREGELDGFGGGRKMCRVVGIARKHVACGERDRFEETGSAVSPMPCVKGVRMAVLSIWEAEWSDVEYVKGIVQA